MYNIATDLRLITQFVTNTKLVFLSEDTGYILYYTAGITLVTTALSLFLSVTTVLCFQI